MDKFRPTDSVADIAYQILKEKKTALNYRELIDTVLDILGAPKENRTREMARAHTEINLDSRFVHVGQGNWALKEWQPKGGSRVIKPDPPVKKPAYRLWEQDSDEAEPQEIDEDYDSEWDGESDDS